MAEYLDREHFIPLRKNDLLQLLLADKQLPAQEREPFRQFGRLVSATFHFEYLAQLEELKDAYAVFDPDADTKPLKPLHPEQRKEREDKLFASFTALMERANFKHLKLDDIHAAAGQTVGDWGLRMDLDMRVFERIEVFVRGDVTGLRTKRRWTNLWRLEKIKVPLYQRLVMMFKLRPHRRIDKDLSTDAIYLKVFKDAPKADVDMLVPGSRPRITRLDRAMIAYPLVLGAGLLTYHLVTQRPWESATTFDVATSLTVLGLASAFAGYSYKSFHSYQVKRQSYILQLVRSLYFKGLDSNTGVLMRLLDEAEEQECRETYLAYFCLWKHAPVQGWTSEQLDDFVELYLEGNAGLKVDFEIGDALDKLERLRIVRKDGAFYRAVPLEKALEMLDWKWDNYFKYNNPGPEAPPAL
jgi:hypothetical protein